jgi:hypothetical protein
MEGNVVDVSEPSEKNQAGDFISLSDLEAQYFSTAAIRDWSQVQIRESKSWPMRWAILGIIASWTIIGLVGSIILFLVTRSNLSFIPFTATITSTPAILHIIARFLFWSPEDYRLEEMKQILKVKKLELRHRR